MLQHAATPLLEAGLAAAMLIADVTTVGIHYLRRLMWCGCTGGLGMLVLGRRADSYVDRVEVQPVLAANGDTVSAGSCVRFVCTFSVRWLQIAAWVVVPVCPRLGM